MKWRSLNRFFEGGGLSGKKCAVKSDMLKGIFISKMVLWVKLLVCPWCRGLRGVR